MRTAILLFAVFIASTGIQAEPLRDGMTAWGKRDFKTAIRVFQPLADGGSAEAQYAIGRLHAIGAGFKKDNKVAVTWFAMAARQGHIEAQTALAEKYLSGTNGLTQDFAAAATWFRKAADHGVAESQFKLGQLYAEGRGVPRNFVAAHMWFNLAAAQGHNGAAAKRSLVSLKLSPVQITQAQNLAGGWVKK